MKTRTEILHEQYQREHAYDCLSVASEVRKMEQVANHYTKLAHTAMVLRKMVELMRYDAQISDDYMSCIQHLYEQILSCHETDFGIKLEWKQRAEQKPSGEAPWPEVEQLGGKHWPRQDHGQKIIEEELRISANL